MATFVKFNCFVEDLGKEAHNFSTPDTLMILLTNTQPNAADTIVDTTLSVCRVKSTSNADEIAAGNGYTKKGGQITSVTWAQSAGTVKLYGVKVTFTATGDIGPFQYAVLYNDSGGTTSTRPVIGYWSYGSAVTLHNTETFIVGNSNDGTDWTTTYPILSIT